MSFDYETAAEILETERYNRSTDPGMRNFSTNVYISPDIIVPLLKNEMMITSFESPSQTDDYNHRVWISTMDEVEDRFDIQLGDTEETHHYTDTSPTTQATKQPDESVEETTGRNYQCNDCGQTFAVDNVIEYEGCPECRSTDTEPLY